MTKQLLIARENIHRSPQPTNPIEPLVTFVVMKAKKGQQASITQPLLKDLIQREKVQLKSTFEQLAGVQDTPLAQPDLYQDPGQGYNANFVFPQD